MSSEALPIQPERFAEAIKDLSVASLHLKVLEIRNSIAHLEYSNAQLRPFAEGKEAVHGSSSPAAEPDQDCIDAIQENEAVIARMRARIALVRTEVVDNRGQSWVEFESPEEREERTGELPAPPAAEAVNGSADNEEDQSRAPAPTVNGSSHAEASGGSSLLAEAMRNGTIQMGVIRNGELVMDGEQTSSQARTGSGAASGGGSLTDDQLRRALEERLRMDEQEDDDEGGLHL